MVGIDTNVLVRFLTRDEPDQADLAITSLERALARDEAVFVSRVVICELVWVLRRAYGYPRTTIAEALARLLDTGNVVFEGREGLRTALSAYRTGRGDLADYLIRETAIAAGCESVVTFDKALLQEPGFTEPGA